MWQEKPKRPDVGHFFGRPGGGNGGRFPRNIGGGKMARALRAKDHLLNDLGRKCAAPALRACVCTGKLPLPCCGRVYAFVHAFVHIRCSSPHMSWCERCSKCMPVWSCRRSGCSRGGSSNSQRGGPSNSNPTVRHFFGRRSRNRQGGGGFPRNIGDSKMARALRAKDNLLKNLGGGGYRPIGRLDTNG